MPGKASSKSAGKQAVKGGSGHMAGFKGVGTQKPDKTAVSSSGDGGKFAKGGSGKMAGFSPVKPVKKA